MKRRQPEAVGDQPVPPTLAYPSLCRHPNDGRALGRDNPGNLSPCAECPAVAEFEAAWSDYVGRFITWTEDNPEAPDMVPIPDVPYCFASS